jgi:hypothetical protein
VATVFSALIAGKRGAVLFELGSAIGADDLPAGLGTHETVVADQQFRIVIQAPDRMS